MSLLESTIGWLSPPQCLSCGSEGSSLCEDCSAAQILPFGPRCWRCSSLTSHSRTCAACRRLGGPSYVWITTTYHSLSRDLVRKYKFGHQRPAAIPISKMMTNTFTGYAEDLTAERPNYLIVPIPTATSRVRQRGFDHSVLLARHLSKQLGLSYAQALGRLGQASQVGRGRSERLKQSAGQYFVRSNWQVQGQRILLVDDVITTGGTLLAATDALRRSGALRVDAIVFAKRL
jgi:ComF family protein